MTQQELKEHNKNRKIWQICIVTDDLDKTVKEWVDIYQVGPWTISSFSDKTSEDFMVDGKPVTEPFEFKVAISHIGDMELEIIQPVSGPNIYWDHLKRKGPGLHHIKEYFPTDTIKAEVGRYEKLGIPVTQTGWYEKQDVHYYVDTEEKTGMILELGNCPDIKRQEGTFRVYPEK
ncbi:MAG TPA: hypothetical protein DEB31_08225 [Clostridiales bacterium]|nr:hypothetical protein [Clostridiales bacterium]